MNYFKEYERLKESKQLITLGSVWEDRISQIEVKGFDGTIVLGIFSGQYFYWTIERFMKNFTRVE